MNINIYWKRFLMKFFDEFNPKFPKTYFGEFIKDEIKYRIRLEVIEVGEVKPKIA